MNKIIKTILNPKLELVLLLATTALIFTKPFDLGYNFFGLPRNGEFLGFVLRLSDLSLIYSCYWILLNLFKIDFIILLNLSRVKLNLAISVISLALLTYWFWIDFTSWYSFKNGLLYLISLSLGGILIYKYKPSWLLILIPYFLFDHVLISSSLVLQMWLILGIVANRLFTAPENIVNLKFITKLKIFFFIIVILNISLSLFQILSGHSFGLYWLGESNINIHTIGGIAKQILPFFNLTILRGYGIMPHPNILGFLAVFLLLVLDVFKPKNFNISKSNTFFPYFSILILVFLSFSRMAILSVLIFIIFKTQNKLNHKVFLKAFFNTSCVIFISIVFILGILTRNSSDFYRLEQHNFLINLTKKEPQVIAFGTGPGQYPTHLLKNNITLFGWQNEYFYQPFGNYLIEVGIFGLIINILIANRLTKRLNEFN